MDEYLELATEVFKRIKAGYTEEQLVIFVTDYRQSYVGLSGLSKEEVESNVLYIITECSFIDNFLKNKGNTAVFTTRYVLEQKSDITYVVHDADGDWQFFSAEQFSSEADGRIVSFSEIIEIEPSIADILWIPPGTRAWRTEPTGDWEAGI